MSQNNEASKLTLIKRVPPKRWKCGTLGYYALYKCGYCGNEKIINTYSVTSGRTISCGCVWKKKRLENLKLGHLSTHTRHFTKGHKIRRKSPPYNKGKIRIYYNQTKREYKKGSFYYLDLKDLQKAWSNELT